MTFAASRLTVLAMTAPPPCWKALVLTFRLVPGGPDAMMNGLGRFNPSTVVAKVGMILIPISVAKLSKQPEIVRWKFQDRVRCNGEGPTAALVLRPRVAPGLGSEKNPRLYRSRFTPIRQVTFGRQ